MLYSRKKFRALRNKKKNILTLVLSEKFFLNETKNHNPPIQVKWLVPKYLACMSLPSWYMYMYILLIIT